MKTRVELRVAFTCNTPLAASIAPLAPAGYCPAEVDPEKLKAWVARRLADLDQLAGFVGPLTVSMTYSPALDHERPASSCAIG